MSALKDALYQIKDEIKTVPQPPQPSKSRKIFKPAVKHYTKQATYINGHEVKWETIDGVKVPYIQTSTFYVQYPSANDNVKDIPTNCNRVTYNSDAGCVEYYGLGSKEPLMKKYNQKHIGLPYPKYLSGIETVEEVYLVDLETGELTIDLKINVLDEYSHWLLRLKEFEAQSIKNGFSKAVTERRMAGFIKNLKATRGVDILDPRNKIPDHLVNAIQYMQNKQAVK